MNSPLLLKKYLLIAGFWLALLGPNVGNAVLMPALYVGEGVLAEGQQDRQAAQLVALNEVLFRLTGQSDAAAQLSIGSVEVATLIQSQQIIEREWLDGQGQANRQLRLKVEFDPIAIDERLAQAQWHRWGRERVSVLVWAVVEQAFTVRLLEDPTLERAMQQWAEVYGLDLVRPLGDALDLAQLSVTDIRGGFLDQAMPGLSRYGAGVALMLDLRPHEQGWALRAFWRIDGLDEGYTFIAPTAVSALGQALEGLLQALIGRYATDLNNQSTQRQQIRVVGMRDLVQYTEVLNYLQSLSVIESARIVEAVGSELVFEVVVQGDNLIDMLAVGQTLEVLGTDASNIIELRLQ